ncbi:MAG TPA: hypothetical protein PLO67_19635 [Saprospiraceae bacterium]|nr:hypothetical protein [Saprospiraceae bacterium]HPI08550.1 hypothetical protein [Saprospiraceae bacterium]
MQELLDLVDFTEKTKFRSNSLLDAVIQPDSQMGKIYHAIASGCVHSDKDIMALLPEISSESGLMTLKSRLKNRLCDMVFLLDFREEKNPDRQTAFVECTKKWSSAMILISKNIRSVGIKQLENLLRHTLDFEFTELSMNIIRTLQLYFSTSNIDTKKYEKLDALYQEMEETWFAERSAEKLYGDLMMHHVNTRSDKEASSTKALEHFQRIEPDMQRFSSFKVHFFGRLIETLIYDCRNDYHAMEKVCVDAIRFFEGKKYRSEMVQQAFYYNIITCCLYTRQFEKVESYARQIEAVLETNSFNWFRIQEILLITAMHTEKYDAAFDILMKVQANPYLQSQPPQIIEIWKIFEAYVWYLISVKKIDVPENELPATRFKISRFLNEVPLLSKDKGGMNISVLIIQFLFFIANKKVAECENRIDAMNKYCSRYLSDTNSLRSQYFIKMLLQVPQSDFKLKLIHGKTEKYYTLLLNTPWHAVNQHREVEVIPYENLWPIVLESLQYQPASGAGEFIPLYSAQRMSA